jgi:ribonuclease P protein component
MKRLIREAYRKNKQFLLDALKERGCYLSIAFIYISDELASATEIEDKMKVLLARIAEKLP